RSTISEAPAGRGRTVQPSLRGRPDEDGLRPTAGSRHPSSLLRGGPTTDGQRLDTSARSRRVPRRGPSSACRRLRRTPSQLRELATRAPASPAEWRFAPAAAPAGPPAGPAASPVRTIPPSLLREPRQSSNRSPVRRALVYFAYQPLLDDG